MEKKPILVFLIGYQYYNYCKIGMMVDDISTL